MAESFLVFCYFLLLLSIHKENINEKDPELLPHHNLDIGFQKLPYARGLFRVQLE